MKTCLRITDQGTALAVLLFLTVALLIGIASPAHAIVEFQKVFIDEYIDEHPDKKFAKFVKRKARCHICHQGKANKYDNIYGAQLSLLLDHEADKKDVEKITAAIREVASLPFDPEVEDGESFADRIAASKLPGGDDLDELKKEPEGAEEDDFVSLFDGETLEGWIGSTDGYEVRDGAIASIKGQGRNLFTEAEYADFVLRFEFLLTPGANNGIGIRAPLRGDVAFSGIELQVIDNTAEKYANLEPYQYHGSAYGIAPAEQGHLKPVGEWNEQEVSCDGRQITVVLNGETILDVNLDEVAPDGKTIDGHEHPGLERTAGHIGFLGHGDVVEFRNLRIMELGVEEDEDVDSETTSTEEDDDEK
ncbi:MAG: 3-keto-disaccharide hydrolase [Aeoliella sp.]